MALNKYNLMNLMNRLKEKFENLDFGFKKWPIYPILEKIRLFLK